MKTDIMKECRRLAEQDCAFFKLIAVVMAAVMVLTLVAGCNKEEDSDSSFEPPEFVYVSEIVPLPDDIGDIQAFTYANDKLFFVTNSYEIDEETQNYTAKTDIYSMNIDGSDFAKLAGYTPPTDVPDNASGGASINALKSDSDGNLWIIERYDFFVYNLPDDFDEENDMAWNYYEPIASGSAIRKLDNTGKELLSIDLAGVQGMPQDTWINVFGVDGDGNLYILVNDWDRDIRTVFVLDSAGNKQFEVKVDNWINEFILTPDGAIAFTEETYGDFGFKRVLRTIDFSAKTLGTSIDIPQNAWNVYPGSGDYDLLFNVDDNLFGFTAGEEEPSLLLNWIDSDIINNNIQNITMISGDRLLCTNQYWDNKENASVSEVLILMKTPYSELPEKTVLTLAALYTGNIREAVVAFNRASPDYRIQVIDYSQFNNEDDWNAGLTRLTAEIVAGKVPDILFIPNLPYEEYAEKGLLADLYAFIDADPELSRSDFVESAFRAAEIDGKLYQVFSTFTVNTIAGHPSVVGTGTSWNMDEFNAVLDAHPDADLPLGQWLTGTSFLQAAIALNIDDYINWKDGTVNFDTPEFIQLLEYSNALPGDINWDGIGNWEDWYVPEEEAIATGRQIMVQMTIYDFPWYMYYKALFGGEVVFKGFPTGDGSGNSLNPSDGFAISEKSPHKDAAWAFMRTLLTEDYQLRSWGWGLPTNQAAFDFKVAEAMELQEGMHNINGINVKAPTQADVDAVIALINSTSGTSSWSLDQTVWEIISEGIADYYNGVSSAQDVARVIQSRVSILVSERS